MWERPEQPPAIRVTAMPAHTNMYGDIFGGWLMSQMDLAASSVASRHARGRAVTVAVDGMSFHQAVVVGDEVSVYADLTEVGRTSMKVSVQAWARERHEGEPALVTRAAYTFVAVGADRRPRPVPPLTGPPAEAAPPSASLART
ncbi:acyl-CoA thioesterase [Ornithinimicrobium sp. LYQ92]|uniref:acyl-CoA thioesterase n=2 Tax=unclassified Serinicoccus TaxID=2643101 RepID=UPI0038523A3D